MPHPLIEKFKDCTTHRGGVYIFAPADAINVIEAARRDGCRVLGIDGFFRSANATEPSLENSIDHSDAVRRGADTNRTALRFVEERANCGLHFEIILTR